MVNINFVSGVLVGHELLQLVVRLCADIIYFQQSVTAKHLPLNRTEHNNQCVSPAVYT